MRRLIPAAARTPVTVALGVLSAAAGLLLAGLGGVALALTAPLPRPRRALLGKAGAAVRRMAAWECHRLGVTPEPSVPDTRRAATYLAARTGPAVLGALALCLLLFGGYLAAIVLASAARGRMTAGQFLLQLVIGGVLFALNWQAIVSVAGLDRRLASNLLTPSARDLLERRVGELAASRAGVMSAVDTERQRIERDLHDGLQQRLVALGMLLGRARRSQDPAKAAELLAQAHAAAQQAIDDLREVAWRVYPSALEHSGLPDVLALVAQRSPVPVRIEHDLPARPARQTETALYFVACEAITNAAKHAGATMIKIEIGWLGAEVRMLVSDDGTGGADPDGTGLRGLERRVAALDGRFTVDSPAGGPTTIEAVLPCG
ncbi:sensor histidine kinase [Longispora albida]|uniref:sensor histidine kinase n=1 Tax=Longispora albida TaxID=203523 RepID=UPI0003AA55A9|nr:histidine kinase [Longispora albida]